jgi:MarR family transcriptional regulator, transcriptional regulator for hemolysin
LQPDYPDVDLSGYSEAMAATATERTVPDLSFLLTHTAHVLATRMAAQFAEIETTPRGYCVLVHAKSGEYTQVELAAMADLDKTTMVVTLDDLEAAGFATREPCPTDRRARIVRVTEAGERAIAIGTEIADRVHREVLEALPAQDRDRFVAALQALANGHLAEPVGASQPVRRARQAR